MGSSSHGVRMSEKENFTFSLALSFSMRYDGEDMVEIYGKLLAFSLSVELS